VICWQNNGSGGGDHDAHGCKDESDENGENDKRSCRVASVQKKPSNIHDVASCRHSCNEPIVAAAANRAPYSRTATASVWPLSFSKKPLPKDDLQGETNTIDPGPGEPAPPVVSCIEISGHIHTTGPCAPKIMP
jgi:hypothetical protein